SSSWGNWRTTSTVRSSGAGGPQLTSAAVASSTNRIGVALPLDTGRLTALRQQPLHSAPYLRRHDVLRGGRVNDYPGGVRARQGKVAVAHPTVELEPRGL